MTPSGGTIPGRDVPIGTLVTVVSMPKCPSHRKKRCHEDFPGAPRPAREAPRTVLTSLLNPGPNRPSPGPALRTTRSFRGCRVAAATLVDPDRPERTHRSEARTSECGPALGTVRRPPHSAVFRH